MKKLIGVAWMLLAWPAHAQTYTSDLECLHHYNQCQSAGHGLPWLGLGAPIDESAVDALNRESAADSLRRQYGAQLDAVGSVYSTPAPARNWNLLIQNTYSTSLTVHLYKEECEALLSQFTSVPPATQTCFQTPANSTLEYNYINPERKP